MKAKYLITLILLLAGTTMNIHAQLTLEKCKEMARENYPVIKQYGLVEQSRDFTVSNAAKAYLPQISLSAKASWQSDATKMPISIPGVSFKGLPRDQYDVNVMVSQSIYDGGAVSLAKKIAKAQGEVDYESVNVSMYDINERVEQIYFGILILDEQIRQADLLIDDLQLSMNTVSSMYKGGIANQTDVDAVSVEQITTAQEKTGMEATRRAYITMLSTFIGTEIADGETFEMPETEDVYPMQNNRPELALYDAQSRLLDERLKAINSDLRPHLGIFAQGGYANPALNLFKNGFEAYYKIGATLSWNFGSFYTRGNDKRKIDVERQTIESQRETFLFNTRLQSELEGGEIDRLRKQIKQDEEIIALRENIRSKSEMKVENGTETVNEMLRDINSVSEARLQKSLHEVQLLQEIYKLRTINNY